MLKKIDKKILYTTLILVFLGILIFFSASLPSLKNTEFFISIFSKQMIAFLLGLLVLFAIINLKFFNGPWLKRNALYIFIFGSILQVLVLVPEVGITLKGAQRWVSFDFITIQPSEFFKYTFIIFFSALVVTLGSKLKKWWIFLVFLFFVFVPIFIFFLYIRDLGTLTTISFASLAVLLISKIEYRKIFLSIIGTLVILLPLLYFSIPYVHDRLEVYINPQKSDTQNEGWQTSQMVITTGSGELSGRGYAGSLQKYSGNLPEYLGDSIFAVYSEEFGFLGSILLIFLFILWLFFILQAAQKIKNSRNSDFQKMVIVGFAILLIFPVFYNIGSVLGVVPLSGMPITFVSKGGTAIFSALVAIGNNFSVNKKKKITFYGKNILSW